MNEGKHALAQTHTHVLKNFIIIILLPVKMFLILVLIRVLLLFAFADSILCNYTNDSCFRFSNATGTERHGSAFLEGYQIIIIVHHKRKLTLLRYLFWFVVFIFCFARHVFISAIARSFMWLLFSLTMRIIS